VRASAAVGWPAEFPSCWRRPGSSQVRLCLFFPQAEAHVHTAREEHDLHGPRYKMTIITILPSIILSLPFCRFTSDSSRSSRVRFVSSRSTQ
jgi:hypothetical protein